MNEVPLHAKLRIIQGPTPGRLFILRLAQRFSIGRGEDVSIRFHDSAVSRRHAEVRLSPEGDLFVTDLDSVNGTLVDGRRLTPGVPLRVLSGETITVGANVIGVNIVGTDDDTRRQREQTQLLDAPGLPKDEFDILGGIGEGAHGRVYAAHQPLLNRTVAIKVMRDLVGDEDEEWQRFLREGRTCGKLCSPYVVKVYDIRLSNGRVYLVMELVNGPSLKDRLANGPLPVPDALSIAQHVAEGLAAAHAEGVIHRDVKPSNILLSQLGFAKLSDFGCAKEKHSNQELTPSSFGIGSLPYVAPEQALDAKSVDERTDVYGLGATIYHMLGGRPPFRADSPRVLLELVETPPEPLLDLRQDLPVDLARLVHAMLEKDPLMRPPTAKSVSRQLEEIRSIHFGEHEYVVPEPSMTETASLPPGFYDRQFRELERKEREKARQEP